VQPAASAGATFDNAPSKGTFQGTIAATTGSYRRCGTGTWTRSSTTVTVTVGVDPIHGLQSQDMLLIASSDSNQSKTTAAPVTVTGATTFTYTGSSAGGSAASGTSTAAGVRRVGSVARIRAATSGDAARRPRERTSTASRSVLAKA